MDAKKGLLCVFKMVFQARLTTEFVQKQVFWTRNHKKG